ncbi:hypothetical protein ZOSMA_48G00100 [Zostera marina]|uniref:CASP-like protein n=1 Tax=Zostera marina TaxID=29655 RepID=A0A0K9NZ43_ZOSMR|nr:hypothetical protein ZOSMA_48G00100 [Zostera marina]
MANSTGFPTTDTPVSDNISSHHPVVGSPVFHHPFQTPSPANYQQSSYPTPSPIRSVSVIHSEAFDGKKSNLGLRILAFIFVSVSAITTVVAPIAISLSVFRYLITISIIVSVYSGVQVFTCIKEMSDFERLFFSEKTWDYTTFIFDQVLAYLLISSFSVAVTAFAIEGIGRGKTKITEVISICLLFVAFVFVFLCSLRSGFNLCKRTMW